MSRYYQRPENALKKAIEFIEVGKPNRALDTLYDVIKGKKHNNRTFSEKVIEPIMLKYLELCVELKKPHTAKEGLYQYRVMCQSVNVGLLEKVIRSYLKMAEDRTEQAREGLKDKVLLETCVDISEVDDLENVGLGSITLLNVITEEQAQERSDRAALIPWVKFLWESYTQCLDLLRNNSKLESLYHDIAQMAFKFCLSYNRKTEFRKLCERLRKHFDDILNRTIGQSNIDLTNPETQQLNMETRLVQLDAAITMELWQEAYKAIEDIHLLMNQSRKSQTRMMAYYYQKLSLVFWKAGNLLFHAATLLKYYNLCKDMKKNVSIQELQKNASQVVLATLAIPFPVIHPEFERFVETEKGMLEKAQKLATLLFLPSPPTRASLVRDLERYNVLGNSAAELQKLYTILETEFNPLELCGKVEKTIKDIRENSENEYLECYMESVEDITLVRFIKQISQIYQSIDYERLSELTVFAHPFRLEQLIVDLVRFSDMQITIDHRENCVRFGTMLTEFSKDENSEEIGFQEMPSEFVRMQLVNVIRGLEDSLHLINPDHVSASEEKLRNKIYGNYLLVAKKEHIQVLQRQKIISNRREELERTQVERENEEKWKSEQLLKQQIAQEEKRLEEEREEREKRKREMEIAEIQQRRVRDKIGQMAQTKLGKLVVSKMDEEDIEKLDIETMMQKQQQELQKEASERATRLAGQQKRLDHLERGRRIEEIPIIEQYMAKKKEEEKAEWELHEKEQIAQLIEERAISVNNRDRMKRMIDEKNAFLKSLLEARRGVYLKKLSDYEKKFGEEKSKRLQERKIERVEQRRRKYLEEKELEERRRQDEIRLEQETKERELKEKYAREMEERNRLTLEKTMAKDKEIEDRLEKQKGEATGRVEAKATVAWRPSFRQKDDTAPQGGRNLAGEYYDPRRAMIRNNRMGVDREGGTLFERKAGGERDRAYVGERDQSSGGQRDRQFGGERDRSFGGDRGSYGGDRDRGSGGDRDRGSGVDRERGPIGELSRGSVGERDRGSAGERDRGTTGERDRGSTGERDRGSAGDRDRGGYDRERVFDRDRNTSDRSSGKFDRERMNRPERTIFDKDRTNLDRDATERERGGDGAFDRRNMRKDDVGDDSWRSTRNQQPDRGDRESFGNMRRGRDVDSPRPGYRRDERKQGDRREFGRGEGESLADSGNWRS